jgi:nucleotide-binding universal stress UspA family protein
VVVALPEGVDPAPCAWWSQVLSDGLGSKLHELHVTRDDLCSALAARAAHVDAALIVLPPVERSLGRAVTSLVSTTRMPVLVARNAKSQGSNTIVAATDLQSTAYPVLRVASTFERCLKLPVVTLHNVQPLSMVVGTGTMGLSSIILPPTPGRAQRLARLARVSSRLFGDAQPVLRDEASVAYAILDEAQRHDAALVVVGARKRSWWERLLIGSIAEQIVEHAQHSVLVTPLDDPCS